MYIIRLFRTFLFIIFIAFSFVTKANENFDIIRDAEIEEILTEIAKPVFAVAGLRPEDAKIYVINSETINAFTIGNGYIFINSGLLLKFENPLHFIGVLCHEVGHIAAGHITRLISNIENRSSNFMVAMLAGILGAMATGSPDAIAVLLGYAMTDERLFLRFSREQEFAADALAASYAIKLGYNANILIEVFDAFERMEILSGGANLPIYIRSHPKSVNRISAIRKYETKQKYKADKELVKKYKRVITKLRSYLKPNYLHRTIPIDDYPRAIYFHKSGKSKQAIVILGKLIKENPSDIYYKDTIAQILTESGRAPEAIKYYKQICSEKSHVLLKIDFARALVMADQEIDKAISLLESAKYVDRVNPEIFRLLANAYGKKGRKGLSFLMLAQEQMLLQNYDMAKRLLKSCIEMMDKKTEASHIKKAQDFKAIIEREYGKTL